MVEIVIHPLAQREFEVEVRDGGRSTTHRVNIAAGLIDELGLQENLEPVVRESFVFLLEREPSSSILRQFSLGDISRYFPEYRQEMLRRLA